MWGLLLWTPLKLRLLPASRVLGRDNAYVWLSEPGNLYLTVVCASALYSALLGVAYGRRSAIWFLVKLCIFPFYVLGQAMLLMGGPVYWVYSGLQRLWRILTNPLTGPMLTVSNFICNGLAASTQTGFLTTLAAWQRLP
jgi:hypothetical protein